MPKCCIDCAARYPACQDTCGKAEIVRHRELKAKKEHDLRARLDVGMCISDAVKRMHGKRR